MEKPVVGDRYDGVLLEVIKDEKISRPRVRPLECFPLEIRVEFPRSLRDENPIGTRFRADVKVSQKTDKEGKPFGSLYLVATNKSIFRIEEFVPSEGMRAVRLKTQSNRAYKYTKSEAETGEGDITFGDLRSEAYENSEERPPSYVIKSPKTFKRKELIKMYALIRSQGVCEGCGKDAPFLRRNGAPY